MAGSTVHGAFQRQALLSPDASALLELEQFGPSTVLYTYAELSKAVLLLASAIRATAAADAPLPGTGSGASLPNADDGADGGSSAGLRQCAFLIGSSPARIVAYLACLAAGFVFTPLETGYPPAVLVSPPPLPQHTSWRPLWLQNTGVVERGL